MNVSNTFTLNLYYFIYHRKKALLRHPRKSALMLDGNTVQVMGNHLVKFTMALEYVPCTSAEMKNSCPVMCWKKQRSSFLRKENSCSMAVLLM